MTDEILIRLTEDGPFRYRDRYVSIGRGRIKACDADHAEHLIESTDYFEPRCNVVKSDGDLCAEPDGDCQYHDTTDEEEEVEEEESVDGSED